MAVPCLLLLGPPDQQAVLPLAQKEGCRSPHLRLHINQHHDLAS